MIRSAACRTAAACRSSRPPPTRPAMRWAQDARSQVAWVDRSGKQIGTVGDRRLYTDFALSPDETRIAASIAPAMGRNQLNESVWVIDVKRGVTSRLTFGEEGRSWPVWSPDGPH